jgi:acetolactate synthase-1/2/3 large subunit
MRMASVGATLGRCFRAAGARWVFGLPGGETLDLMEALRQEGLEFVLTRHETAAAIMAATVGELTGAPGLCLSTLGPGATNMVTGVAQAYLDRSPLVAMSAQIPAARQAILTHQMLDLEALYRPVTKWAASVNTANAGRVARKAMAVAAEWPAGPVHLAIPSDVPRQQAGEEPVPFPAGVQAPARAFGFGDLAAVRALLRQADRPALIVGLSAMRAGAGAAALDLARWLGCPVYDLPKAKGVFPEDHPQFVGTLEMAGTQVLFRQLAEADLLVAFGVDPVEYDHWWDFPGQVVTFDLLPNLAQFTPSQADVVGPFAAAVRAVVGDAPPRPARDCSGLRAELEEAVRAGSHALAPRQVVEALRAALPPAAILTTDTGAHKMAAGQFWRTGQPFTYLVSNGLSTMGFAIPAAIGARLARPEVPVAAITGDGGFMMSAGELETAARLGLSLLVVVMVDGELGSIRLNQARRGYPEQGVRFGCVDHAALARALGASAWEAASPAELGTALAEATAVRGPAVVAARVDGGAYRL